MCTKAAAQRRLQRFDGFGELTAPGHGGVGGGVAELTRRGRKVVDLAPERVRIAGRHIGEALASGAEIERWGAVLYTFGPGKILRVDGYLFSDRTACRS
jgi:hypothetical protein